MHLGQYICEAEKIHHLMRAIPSHWNDIAIEIRDKSPILANSYLARILKEKRKKEN